MRRALPHGHSHASHIILRDQTIRHVVAALVSLDTEVSLPAPQKNRSIMQKECSDKQFVHLQHACTSVVRAMLLPVAICFFAACGS